MLREIRNFLDNLPLQKRCEPIRIRRRLQPLVRYNEVTGKSYDHRQDWLETLIAALAECLRRRQDARVEKLPAI